MHCIITTTINPPTQATIKFCELTGRHEDWYFIIIGDTKTPHDDYKELERKHDRIHYLTPEAQEQLFPELSETIGWKSIQRRNIGFVYAHALGAEVISTVDDDNIPYDHWGEDIKVGSQVEYDAYECRSADVFDPLSVTEDNHLWHRGYPVQLLQQRHEINSLGKQSKLCLVQANLWDGDPDIDAMARLSHMPEVNYSAVQGPYGSSQIAPFNSQNTFLHRSVFPYYAVLPHVGRMDDIWGSYIMQQHFPNVVIYDVPTVYQDRNEQDLVTNLENEILGYRKTLTFIEAGLSYCDHMPEKTQLFWRCYLEHFDNDLITERVINYSRP